MTGSSLEEAEVACARGGGGNWNPEAEARGVGETPAAAMKVKMLSRNPDHYVRETKLDLQRGEASAREPGSLGPGPGCPRGKLAGGWL